LNKGLSGFDVNFTMLVYVISMNVMEVTLMEIIHVIPMRNHGVLIVCVPMRVIFMRRVLRHFFLDRVGVSDLNPVLICMIAM